MASWAPAIRRLHLRPPRPQAGTIRHPPPAARAIPNSSGHPKSRDPARPGPRKPPPRTRERHLPRTRERHPPRTRGLHPRGRPPPRRHPHPGKRSRPRRLFPRRNHRLPPPAPVRARARTTRNSSRFRRILHPEPPGSPGKNRRPRGPPSRLLGTPRSHLRVTPPSRLGATPRSRRRRRRNSPRHPLPATFPIRLRTPAQNPGPEPLLWNTIPMPRKRTRPETADTRTSSAPPAGLLPNPGPLPRNRHPPGQSLRPPQRSLPPLAPGRIAHSLRRPHHRSLLGPLHRPPRPRKSGPGRRHHHPGSSSRDRHHHPRPHPGAGHQGPSLPLRLGRPRPRGPTRTASPPSSGSPWRPLPLRPSPVAGTGPQAGAQPGPSPFHWPTT